LYRIVLFAAVTLLLQPPPEDASIPVPPLYSTIPDRKQEEIFGAEEVDTIEGLSGRIVASPGGALTLEALSAQPIPQP
jgi:hypothetical protein